MKVSTLIDEPNGPIAIFGAICSTQQQGHLPAIAKPARFFLVSPPGFALSANCFALVAQSSCHLVCENLGVFLLVFCAP